jgi:hypothetical protein
MAHAGGAVSRSVFTFDSVPFDRQLAETIAWCGPRAGHSRECHIGSISPLMSFPVKKHPIEPRSVVCSSVIFGVAALRSANVAITSAPVNAKSVQLARTIFASDYPPVGIALANLVPREALDGFGSSIRDPCCQPLLAAEIVKFCAVFETKPSGRLTVRPS